MSCNIKLLLLFTLINIFKCIEGYANLEGGGENPFVETKLGLIRGLRATDGDYAMFMGIPYATLNETNPFVSATLHTGFTGSFEAYNDSVVCPQIEEFNDTFVGSLDCLHLNIYVPNTPRPKNRLPVLVWIHGGRFVHGWSGRYRYYGPKYLVRQNIILVTINYRLGPYGFMCLNTPEIPGNQGLKDQQLALKWIKDNIESFGGDPNSITLAGSSSGASLTDLHLHYGKPSYFNKVIMQSGTAYMPLTFIEPNTSAAFILAKHLGFKTEDNSEAIAFLSKCDPRSIIVLSIELDLNFNPCVEQNFDGNDAFLLEHPTNLKQFPRISDTYILIGNTNEESLYAYIHQDIEYLNNLNAFYKTLRDNFKFESNELNKFEEIVRHFYIADQEMRRDVLWGISEFVSDFSINHPASRSIQTYLENNASVVYQYVFSYVGKRNFLRNKVKMTEGGAVHADELGYMFETSDKPEEPTPMDQLIIDRTTTMWANFVKYGNPTPHITELLPVQWKPVTKENSYYLDINTKLSVGKRPLSKRMAFWDLFYKINRKAQKEYKAP